MKEYTESEKLIFRRKVYGMDQHILLIPARISNFTN
jgi:hypothetical protein